MDTPSAPSRSQKKPHKRREPPRPLIISEEIFSGVLIKERRRAYRLNQPLVLLVVALKDRADVQATWMWVPVLEALATMTRETDIVGWFEWRTAIGVILPEVRAVGDAKVAELEARFNRELARRADADTLRRLSVRLYLHADPKRVTAEGRDASGAADVPTPHAVRKRTTIYDAIKRALDIIGSSTLLAALLPLLVAIAVAVKVKSRGPVFFEQERVGQNMKPFRMLKFRTMYADADHKAHHEYVTWFIQSSGTTQAGATPSGVFKLTNDARITPVGRILRKTSLDELPQLLNVLIGDMSLVGPRPPLAYELEQYKPWHCRRVLDAKPGITGLWQVTGRSRTTFDDMVRLDLRYAKTCSIWTDIKILLATPGAVLSGKGAC